MPLGAALGAVGCVSRQSEPHLASAKSRRRATSLHTRVVTASPHLTSVTEGPP